MCLTWFATTSSRPCERYCPERLAALFRLLRTPAGYIGAMGSRRTTEERAERLRAEGVTDEELARARAPIGLRIGARTPEEVALAIAGELVQAMRERLREGGAARIRAGARMRLENSCVRLATSAREERGPDRALLLPSG